MLNDCHKWKKNLHVIKSKLFALASILLPSEILFFEPEVLLNGTKFKVRINIKRLSVI